MQSSSASSSQPAGRGPAARRLIVACGGTGGHVFPGLAIAGELRRRGYQVELWLAGRDVEKSAAAAWDGAVTSIPARGLPTGISWRTLWNGTALLAAVGRCILKMRRGPRPAAVLAMGGYGSVGPGLAANLLNIPLILHEANAIPGRAIALLARRAAAVALAFPEAAECFPGAKTHITGFPLREAEVAGEDDFDNALPHDPGERFTLLVTGGSQGAHRLNEIVTETLCAMHSRGTVFQVIHLAGKRDEQMVRARYEASGVPAAVFGFLRRMDRAYAAAHLAICRAGAATCAELAAAGLPALLVPLPTAARDHQTANAKAVAQTGAARMIPESQLHADWLADFLNHHIAAPAELERMRAAARQRGVLNATARTAGLVASLAQNARATGGTPA